LQYAVFLGNDFFGRDERRVRGRNAGIEGDLHERFFEFVLREAALLQPGADMQREFLPAAQACRHGEYQ